MDCAVNVSPTCKGKALTISRQSVGTKVFVSVLSVVYDSEDIYGQDLRISDSQIHRDTNDFKMIATVKKRRLSHLYVRNLPPLDLHLDPANLQ